MIEARARRTDPISSHAAAAHMNAEGIADDHREIVMRLVKAHPGSTSYELSMQKDSSLDRYQIARRLKELEKQERVYRGEQRDDEYTGRLSVTFYPTTAAQNILRKAA